MHANELGRSNSIEMFQWLNQYSWIDGDTFAQYSIPMHLQWNHKYLLSTHAHTQWSSRCENTSQTYVCIHIRGIQTMLYSQMSNFISILPITAVVNARKSVAWRKCVPDFLSSGKISDGEKEKIKPLRNELETHAQRKRNIQIFFALFDFDDCQSQKQICSTFSFSVGLYFCEGRKLPS